MIADTIYYARGCSKLFLIVIDAIATKRALSGWIKGCWCISNIHTHTETFISLPLRAIVERSCWFAYIYL